MTFEEATNQAIKNQRATRVADIFKVYEEAAELYATSQYNKAVEDAKGIVKEWDCLDSMILQQELDKLKK